MTAIYVEQRLPDSRSDSVSIAQFWMATGYAYRLNSPAALRPGIQPYDSTIIHPWAIAKNMHGRPLIWPLYASIIISNSIMRELAALANVGFSQVEFTKIIDIPYLPTFNARGNARDEEEFYNQFSGNPDIISTLQPYYEIMPVMYNRINMLQFVSCLPMQLHTAVRHDDAEYMMCRQMLDTYPIIWAGNGYVISGRARDVVMNELDERLFDITEIDLPN